MIKGARVREIVWGSVTIRDISGQLTIAKLK